MHRSCDGSINCSKMDGVGRHYTKGKKPDKERQILYNITYMWNLKNITDYEYNKKKQIQRSREQMRGHQ